MAKAGSMKDICKLSLKNPDMKEAAMDSVASAKVLLSQVLSFWQLKGDNFAFLYQPPKKIYRLIVKCYSPY